MKKISDFCKENKFLTEISSVAIIYIVLYIVTYDFPELWHNAHVLVDILFQLSLAIIANLIFYISQVYIPFVKSKSGIRFLIKRKVEIICSLIESPFLNIAKKYLGCRKKIVEITDITEEEMHTILLKYKANDILDTIGNETIFFGAHFKDNFRAIKTQIEELLTLYSPYLNGEEKDALIRLKDNSFYELFIVPFTAIEGVTKIVDEKQIDEFREFQREYIKVKDLIKKQEGTHNGRT